MSQKANPTLIGAFVLGAAALAVAAVLVFGGGRLFEHRERWVIFFAGSVSGLDEGAPVLFRGVQVGRVAEIEALYIAREGNIEIPVYIDFLPGRVRTQSGQGIPEGTSPIETLIERGMRAQLASQSLVTGKLYVSLDMRPGTPALLKGLDPSTPEIPAIPTVFQEAEKVFTDLMNRLQKVDVEAIARSLEGALASAQDLLSSPEVKQSIANVDQAAAAVRDLAKTANGQVGRAGASLIATSDQARDALEKLEDAVEALRREVGPGSPVQYQLVSTLEEVSRAARALRTAAETINAQPDSLLFGRRTTGGEQ